MTSLSRRHVLCGLAAVGLSGCQVAPGTGKSGFNLMSADEERRLGRDTHPQILREFGGAYEDAGLQAYVAGIGQRLGRLTETPDADFRFTILNSPIVNAMALPGGYVYVTRGLMALCTSEAELAGVMGHELGHVLARHTAERVSQAQASNLLVGVLGAVVGVPGVADLAGLGAAAYLQSFSRDQESEADHLGVRYMARGGWNPHAMVSMLNQLRDQARLEAIMAGRSPDSIDSLDFMASHPRTLDRVHAAMAALQTSPDHGSYGAETYLDRIGGLTFGDDVRHGLVRGTAFLHPAEGFRFDVPNGFRLINSDKAVIGQNANGSTIIFDGAPAKGGGDMLAYISQTWLPRSRLANGERIQLNGMEAATATTQGRTRQGTVDVRVVAVRFDGDSIYRFTFFTPPRLTAPMGEDLRRTTYSLRPLTDEERRLVHPWRIQVIHAKAGDTVESLAARMAQDTWKVEHFRLLNGLAEGDRLEPGRRVKLVI
jgi:predicted Zn-dependent protease